MFLDNCRRLVGLDSTPSHGNLAAAEFLKDLCLQAGLHVELQRELVDGVEQANLIARPSADKPPREFMLQTHLDTSEPGHFSQWTKTQSNPFNASIYGDEFFGLGSADAKLDFLCKLEAVKEFTTRPLKIPFVLVGTFGAESGMDGAIKLMRRKKISATHALVGKPTGMKLATAGQGQAVLEILVPFADDERAYRQTHDQTESSSSQSRFFSAGENGNAILKMLAYLRQLPEAIAVMDLNGGVNFGSIPATAVLEIDTVAGFKDPIGAKISRIYARLQILEEELKTYREEGFNPPHPTVNLGMIRTDSDEIRITGCCRLPPSITDDVYEGWIKKLDASVRAEGATFRVKDYRRGFNSPARSEFVEATVELARALNLSADLHKMTESTEASVLSRLGIECVVWGPGASTGSSHLPNESIDIRDLKTAIEFYRRALERFCL